MTNKNNEKTLSIVHKLQRNSPPQRSKTLIQEQEKHKEKSMGGYPERGEISEEARYSVCKRSTND